MSLDFNELLRIANYVEKVNNEPKKIWTWTSTSSNISTQSMKKYEIMHEQNMQSYLDTFFVYNRSEEYDEIIRYLNAHDEDFRYRKANMIFTSNSIDSLYQTNYEILLNSTDVSSAVFLDYDKTIVEINRSSSNNDHKAREDFLKLLQHSRLKKLAETLKIETTSPHQFSRKYSLLKRFDYSDQKMSQLTKAVCEDDVFYELFEYSDADHYSMFAYNDSVHEKEYEKMLTTVSNPADDEDFPIIYSILGQSDVSSTLLMNIYENFSDDKLVNVLVARHENASTELLNKIIEKNINKNYVKKNIQDFSEFIGSDVDEDNNRLMDKDIACAVYAHKNLDKNVIHETLLDDTVDVRVRRVIARNSSASFSDLYEVLKNEDFDYIARFNALMNPVMPTSYRNIYLS